MNGKPIPRNKDGLIEKECIDCGLIRYSKKDVPRDRCVSCGKRHRFKSQPAVGLKQVGNIDVIIREYESGSTLWDLAAKYKVSAMTIRSKILSNGGQVRNYSEAAIEREKCNSTIIKAHAKVRELCKTGEFQKQRSAILQGVPIEKWKGFITPANKQLYKTLEYKQWQRTVFERDNHTCQLCGKTKCPIAAHHIYPKAKYPSKVLDIKNGITLCNQCHHKTIGHEDKYVDICEDILCGRKR